MSNLKRIAVLISGSGSNLQALIEQIHQANDVPAQIVLVISNRADAYGLVRAEAAGIPTLIINHRDYPDRAAFDHALQSAIDATQADLVVLAGFMRILTPIFVQHFQGRLLNIHPSLLPAYKGTHTHQRVLDDNQTEHGVSVHFVTPELDDGPVILQAKIPILATDNAETLAKRIHQQEHIIYPEVVRWCVTGRLKWQDFQYPPLFDNTSLTAPQVFYN